MKRLYVVKNIESTHEYRVEAYNEEEAIENAFMDYLYDIGLDDRENEFWDAYANIPYFSWIADEYFAFEYWDSESNSLVHGESHYSPVYKKYIMT